jgi:ATP synthase protein I
MSQPKGKGLATRPTVRADDEGMRILSELVTGIVFYGGLGWVADHMWHTSFLMPSGLILGLVSAIYLVIKRHGSDE